MQCPETVDTQVTNHPGTGVDIGRQTFCNDDSSGWKSVLRGTDYILRQYWRTTTSTPGSLGCTCKETTHNRNPQRAHAT